jgi:hypothetical protein
MNKTIIQLIVANALVLTAVFLFIWGWYSYKNQPHPCEYQFIVTDNNVTVYDSKRIVGTIKLEGSLDSLITEDNK